MSCCRRFPAGALAAVLAAVWASAVISSARSSSKYLGITGEVNRPHATFGAWLIGKSSRPI